MGASLRPLHLLPFDHPLAHDLIHRRFDKTGSDLFSVAIPFPIIRDEVLVALHVRVQRSSQRPSRVCGCSRLGSRMPPPPSPFPDPAVSSALEAYCRATERGAAFAGLAADGSDAVARLQHERDVLERLAGLDAVPRLLDSFGLGEHYFVVMEFVEGTPLNRASVLRYPLMGAAVSQRAFQQYTDWALDVCH
jgi:serine/threonine protein kinase